MTGSPPNERAAPPEGSRLPLVCMTCGAVYQSGERVETETCGAANIKFLTCSANSAHNTVYLADWKPGMPCPESRMSRCPGTLQDMRITGPCPGRLTPQIQSSS